MNKAKWSFTSHFNQFAQTVHPSALDPVPC